MRICQVSRTYPRDASPGSGSVAYNLAKHVPAEYLYVAKRLPGKYVEPPPNVELAVFSYWEPAARPGPGAPGRMLLAGAKALGAIWFLVRAAPAVVRFRPDAVHVHSVLTLQFAAFARLVLRRPVVMTFHGTDYLWFRRSRALQWLVDRTVNVVCCVSQEIAEGVSALVKRPDVVTVPNGVNFEMFHERDLTRKRQLVSIGHLKWQKGYEYLLQAMRALTERDASLGLVIAGAGPLQKELERIASSMGIAGNVRFLGVVPQSRVAELLSESRVFVMSSVSEGFPRALLEAMACGIPVVVTDVGECAAVADGAGIVVPPRSPEALAEAIWKLLSDEALWETCSRNAVTRALNFGWEETARRTIEVYRGLVPGVPISLATGD